MRTVDIVVVGGGVIAWSLAWQLALRGGQAACVAIVTDGDSGATLAAAGMLAPSFEARHHRASPNLAALLQESLSLWDGFAEEVEAVSHDRIGYDRSGILALGGLADQLVGENVARAIASPWATACTQAALVEGEGQVDPRRLLPALKRAAKSAGVHVLNGQARKVVAGTNGQSAQVNVTLENTSTVEQLRAHTVILAAGARTDAISPAPLSVNSVYGRAFLATSPILIKNVVRTENVYLCPKGYRTLYIGATEELTSDEGGSTSALKALWKDACAVLPSLKGATILRSFYGPRPISPTGVPIVEQIEDQIWVAAGHDRNGILLTPWTVEKIASAII